MAKIENPKSITEGYQCNVCLTQFDSPYDILVFSDRNRCCYCCNDLYDEMVNLMNIRKNILVK